MSEARSIEGAGVQEAASSEARPRRRRRSRSRSRSSSLKRSRIRKTYFGLAAAWGFFAGSGSVLMVSRASGARFQIDGMGLAMLAFAGLAALVGAAVAARAYHEASKRA